MASYFSQVLGPGTFFQILGPAILSQLLRSMTNELLMFAVHDVVYTLHGS